MRSLICVVAVVLVSACSPSGESASDVRNAPAASPTSSADMATLALGGRLFDKWYGETATGFVPDDPETPEFDGEGGPNGNGTLNDLAGNVILNTGAHNYRLKNLFGWDMRGDTGIYGAKYQAKEFVLPAGPLSEQYANDAHAVWEERLRRGEEGIPAFGAVLSDADIAALVSYMLAVRDRVLVHPDQLYTLEESAPKGFVLLPGGNAERGLELYDTTCAECHGRDGTKVMFDNGEQSLGQHARYYGYAVSMISLVGEPGSAMGPLYDDLPPADEQAQTLLNLLAALCDRDRFGIGPATDPDVPDADPRCGAYLR